MMEGTEISARSRLGTAPPLSNSWIINIIGLYIALNSTPNIDCYWVGAVPKFWGLRILLNPQTLQGLQFSVRCLHRAPGSIWTDKASSP